MPLCYEPEKPVSAVQQDLDVVDEELVAALIEYSNQTRREIGLPELTIGCLNDAGLEQSCRSQLTVTGDSLTVGVISKSSRV